MLLCYTSTTENHNLNYFDFHILLTPQDKEFTVELRPHQEKSISKEIIKKCDWGAKYLSKRNNKRFVAALVTKSIEYGTFHDAIGMTV